MSFKSWVLPCLAAGALASFALPAAAQDDAQLETWCANDGEEFTPELALSACDGLLEKGGVNLAAVHNLRGQAYLQQQDYTRALEAFSASIAANPDLPNPYAGRADVHFAQKEYARAVEDLSAVIALMPDLGAAYSWRARNHMMLDNRAAAIADFSEAVRLDPTLTEAYWMRGQLYGQQEDYARALADAGKVMEREPTAEGYGFRGEVYLRVKDYARAIADHSEAIRLAPEDSANWNARCWDRAVWGRELDQALADCNKAIELDPKNANALDSRGMVRLKRGEWAAAEADYDASARLNPQYGSAVYGRGVARRRIGRDGGVADLAKGIELDPEVAESYVEWGMKP